MKKEIPLSRATRPLLLFCLLLALLPAQAHGAMSDYCSPPPFVAQNISPNILIVLDNSGSMCGQAYGGVYNPAQFTNGLYYGYFDGAKRYLYNGSRWEETTNALNTGTVNNPVATGSFLNWATMRRIEVAKKLLIGGKADPRSPAAGQTVKLKAEIGCSNSRVFSKDFDTSAGNLIFPFVGDYNFKNDDGSLVVTSNAAAGSIVDIRPISDISMPAGWSEFPVNPPTIAYTKVDEASSDGDTTYIQSNNTAAPVIMGYTYAGAEPAGTITVSIYVRAKKTASGSTRRLVQILRVDGVDYEGGADTVSTSYQDYAATWATNPSTGAAWTWSQIKQLAGAGGGNITGLGVRAEQAYASSFIRVTQVYLKINVTSPSGGPYNIIVDQGMVDAKGLVDNLDNDVRFGLAYYNNSNAGRVDNYVGFNSPANMITSIGNMVPSTWTPLGETLHEMVRYFRQDSPYYTNNPADYIVGAQAIGNPNVYRDPYAFKFTDTTSGLPDQYVPCAKSFILFLTDGESTQDQSMPGTSTASPYAACSSTNLKACSGYGGAPNNPNPRHAGTSIGTTYSSYGTDYMIDVAYWARTADARPGTCTTTPTTWDQCLPGTQNIFIYPVYMFGTGSSLLKDVAIYGGFNDINGNNKPDCTTTPAECYKDSNGNGTISSDGTDLPLTYYEGDDGYALEQKLISAIADILKRAASGTAVSVLSSSEGSGANLMQALFYPKRSFDNGTEAAWISDMMNYWYYLDPFFSSSQIREDTEREGVDYTILNLKHDYVTIFGYDATLGKTMANRWADSTGTGTTLVAIPPAIEIEKTLPIWRAGYNLWWTAPSNRTIKTTVNGSSLIDFTTANYATLDDYLGLTASSAAARKTIEYVRGYDCADADGESCVCGTANCVTIGRSRTVTSGTCSVRKNPCSSVSDCASGETCVSETHVWKLGDIISSTPRIMGPSALDSFNKPFPFGYNDQTYSDFIKSTDYKDRELVFVGANDGMLHAFKLGKLVQTWSGKNWYEVAKQEGSLGVGGIGTESYAYIPKNSLPYLQYLYDPNYCHIYMVDGPLALTEAAINKPSTCTLTNYWECPKETTMQVAPNSDKVDFAKTSWRTTLIGSMGIGGATCDADAADADRISTPLSVSGTPVGWSSYFALDVTDQASPQLLWEFNNADLGVTNVGPAYVRVANKVCAVSGTGCTTDSDCGDTSVNGKCVTEKRCAISNAVCSTSSDCGDIATNGQCVEENGRWFVILGSGSTGPITSQQFRGTSDKSLKLFILDLKTGTLLRTIDAGLPPLNITNAFAGSISANALDLEKDRPSDSGTYQDDAVYIGYVQNTTSGGVLRLVINDDIDPAHWTVSKVIDGIGPVTTSVVNLLDRNNQKLWLYFAEGRFFYKLDDLTTQRKLYGIQEPCFDATNNTLAGCTSSLTLLNLKDQSSLPSSTLLDSEKGWYINMNAPSGTLSAERAISNPTPDPLGAIYFLSFAPNADICSFGGTTYLWALDYGTGGKVRFAMQGKALIQVSTGEIKELTLSSAFTENEDRKSAGFMGIPPTGQGLMVVTNPTPIKKFMHVQEQ